MGTQGQGARQTAEGRHGDGRSGRAKRAEGRGQRGGGGKLAAASTGVLLGPVVGRHGGTR